MIKYLIFIILLFLFLVYRKNKINIKETFIVGLEEINTIDELFSYINNKLQNNKFQDNFKNTFNFNTRTNENIIDIDNINKILPNNENTDINQLNLLYSEQYILKLEESQKKLLNRNNKVIDFLYKNKKEKLLSELQELNSENEPNSLAIIYNLIKNYQPTFTINNKINDIIPKDKYILKYELSLNESMISNYTYIPFDISSLPNNNFDTKYFKDFGNNIEDLEKFLKDVKLYYETNDKEDIEKMDFLKYENYKVLIEVINNVDFNKLLKTEENNYNYRTDFMVFPSKIDYNYRNIILIEEQYHTTYKSDVEKLLNSETNLESKLNLNKDYIRLESKKIDTGIENINGYILEKDEKSPESNIKINEIKKFLDETRIRTLYNKYQEKVESQEGDLQNEDDKDKVKNIEIDDQKYTFYLNTYHNSKRLKYSYVMLYLIYNELLLEINGNL